MRIGFVGLGIMGEPKVGHLAAAGNELAVFDVNAEAVGPSARSAWLTLRCRVPSGEQLMGVEIV